MAEVVAIGDVNVDVLMAVDPYPAPGGCAISQATSWQLGGSATNAAIALRHLGLDTAMIGRVGVDPLATWVLEEMGAAGVDMGAVRQASDAMTGFCVVPASPDGERTMFTERGANARLSAEDVDESTIASAKWLHASGYMLFTPEGRAAFAQAIETAHAHGRSISVDVGIGRALATHRTHLRRQLPAIDVLLANDDELTILTGDREAGAAAHAVRAHGTDAVVLKRGASGCGAVTKTGEWELPAVKLDPVDATGAGDAFSAGVIAAQLAGLDWRSTVVLANALGGLSATRQGAGRGLPGRTDAAQLIQHMERSDDWADWHRELAVLKEWLGDSA